MFGNTTNARRRQGTGGKRVKIELTSARKSKGVERFDGKVSKWNKLRINHKASVVDTKNLPPPPTLAVDNVEQRDENDGNSSNTRNNKCELLPAMVMEGSGVAECVTNKLCGSPISSSTTYYHHRLKEQRMLVDVMNCCDDNNDVYTTVTAVGLGACVDIKSQPLQKNDEIVVAEQLRLITTTNNAAAIPSPTTKTTTTTTPTKLNKMLSWMRKQVPRRKVRSMRNNKIKAQVDTTKLQATINAAHLTTVKEKVKDIKSKVAGREGALLVAASTKPRTSHCHSLLDDDKKNDNSMMMEDALQQSLCVEYTEADYKKATKRGPRWLLSILRNSISNINNKKKKSRTLSKKKKSTTTMMLDSNAPPQPLESEEKKDNGVAAMDVSVSSTKVTKGTRLSAGNIEVTEAMLLQHLNKIESELVALKNRSLSPITEEGNDIFVSHDIEESYLGDGYEIIDTNPFACVGFSSLMPTLNKIESDQSMLSPGATDAVTRRITNGGATVTTNVNENNVITANASDYDAVINKFACVGFTTFTHEGPFFSNESYEQVMEEELRMLYDADDNSTYMTGRSEISSQEVECRDDIEQEVINKWAPLFGNQKYNYAGKVIGIESISNNNNNKGGGSESSSDAKTYYTMATMESMDTMVRNLRFESRC